MDQTLIPFALRAADDEIVDVADVSSGLACGCVCPSCSTALIARKGNIKAWHFAHVGRAEDGSTQTRCDFSWDVSVRLMARQLLRFDSRMSIPECIGNLFGDTDYFSAGQQQTFSVAPERAVDLLVGKIDATFAGTLVDVLTEVDGAPFVVYFTYGGRPVPDVLKAPPAPCAGVIAINIPSLAPMFATVAGDLRTPRQILSALLGSDLSAKQWVYHPNYADAQERARTEFAEHVSRRPSVFSTTHSLHTQPPSAAPGVSGRTYALITAPPGEVPLFHCVKCEFKWGLSMGGIERCPQCDSRFMVTRIRAR